MSKITLIARILFGLIFFVFGLNGFLQFLPTPPMSPEAGELMGAFIKSGYMFPLIKATEVVAGALLLAGVYVPLALILLAPITVNIVLFHFCIVKDGYPMTIAILVVHLFLAYSYRDKYKKVLEPK